MRIRKGLIFLCTVVATVLVACGGGGTDSTPDASYGLKTKPGISGLNFPIDPDVVPVGDIRIVNAFPNISFDQPLVFTQAPGDSTRAFVATQGGRIYVFENRADVSVKKIFLDLSDRTKASGEMGLLGFAFDPDYASNGYFYVYYSANFSTSLGDSVIARFKVSADPDVADRSTELQLLRYAQPYTNHNGGALAFGPDKMLYIASGDGGSGGDPQGNGQKLTTPLGKILRIKTDGTIPADNPFVGEPGARGEIWAYGLRNPFRFSFDRSTGKLWAGDVGQDRYEEIDVIIKGGNYGWNTREGLHGYPTASTSKPDGNNFIDPIWEYSHSDGSCSITGGVVYRGAAITKLTGQYLYSDYCNGTVWALSHDDGETAIANIKIGSISGPSGFGEDLAGEVYITSFDGHIYKIELDEGGSPSAFPEKLSETGLFSNTSALTPNPGLVAYEINAPFYSDDASKKRWFGVPPSGRIAFSPVNAFDMSMGSVTVKHFEVTRPDGTTRRLETRVFLHQTDGWHGYTYKWNPEGTDADLLDGSQTETISVLTSSGPRSQTYEYPSRAACSNCHNNAAGALLGLRAAQVNKTFSFPDVVDNQLRAYNHVGLFDRDIGSASLYAVQADPQDPGTPLNERARSYLAVNCAQCHRPGGPTGVDMDLRLETAIENTNALNVAPTAGDLGITGSLRIKAGNKEQSVLWERMRRLDGTRMPPIASHVVDEAGVVSIGQWIDAGAH